MLEPLKVKPTLEHPGWSCECNPAEDWDGVNPVHPHEDGTWWWYDEVWIEEFGPFASKEDADNSCITYANEVLERE